MIDMLKAYLQVANGVGELTRQRALEVARQALAASPAAVVLPVATAGVDGLTAQVSALADDLLAAGRANRELLRQLVRAEVETVVTRLGLGGQADLQAQLAASRERVRELEGTLAQARRTTAKRAAAGKSAAEKAAPKSAAIKRTPVKRSPVKQAPVKRTAAKRAAPTKPTAAAGSVGAS